MKKKEKNNEGGICKKCGKILPTEYEHKTCEACRNKNVHNLKRGVKATGGVLGTVASVGIFIISKGKIKPK